jgi:23S rRNA pseudouridine1911/1915/1917 synthase
MNSIPSIEDLKIIFEDEWLIAVNKPIGISTQKDQSDDIALEDLVKLYLKQKEESTFCGLVHRIDKPVSGLVIFAKTEEALIALNDAFKYREVEKHYLAAVKHLPVPESGTLKHWIVKNTKLNKSFANETEIPNSKEAVLEYTTVAYSEHFHLLKIKLLTGRHHQIRAQLSAIKNPIRGDNKYGYKRSNSNGGINLHSYSLKVKHPILKTPLYLEAPLPSDDFWWIFSLGMSNMTKESN